MQYLVEISDTDGKSFRVLLSIPFLDNLSDSGNSSFQVQNPGFIKYSSGGCNSLKGSGLHPNGIQLVTFGTCGILLDAMFSTMGFVNSSGSGTLQAGWATGAKSGDISWALIKS